MHTLTCTRPSGQAHVSLTSGDTTLTAPTQALQPPRDLKAEDEDEDEEAAKGRRRESHHDTRKQMHSPCARPCRFSDKGLAASAKEHTYAG